MKARTKDKNIAIEMRKYGYTQPDIAKELGASKSIVSLWVKGVKVPEWYSDFIKQKRSNALLVKIETPEWKNAIKRVCENNKIKPIATINGVDYYICNNCQQSKPINRFPKKFTNKKCQCLECGNNYIKKQYRETRNLAIIYLSSGKCEMGCGCNIYELLDIHHINCNGSIDRREITALSRFKKILIMPLEQAKKEYEVLCKVCHNAKHVMIKNPNVQYVIQMKTV